MDFNEIQDYLISKEYRYKKKRDKFKNHLQSLTLRYGEL